MMYTATVTAGSANIDELADLLEAAADRIRDRRYDYNGNGIDEDATETYPCVSGEGQRMGGYDYIVRATAGTNDQNHFRKTGWRKERA